jgi:hypothetical protein
MMSLQCQQRVDSQTSACVAWEGATANDTEVASSRAATAKAKRDIRGNRVIKIGKGRAPVSYNGDGLTLQHSCSSRPHSSY